MKLKPKMMKKYLLLMLLPAGMLASCKKSFTCSCGTEGKMEPVFEVKGSRESAQQQCKEYYDKTLPLILTVGPWNCEVK